MTRSVWLCLLIGLCFFEGLFQAAAQAQIGQSYDLKSFQPYLERGYNTRAGWQGWPVSTETPWLYLHAPQKLSLLAELEFGHQGGMIHTQVLKLYLSPTQSLAHPEAIWFLSHVSKAQLSLLQIEGLLRVPCNGEWRVPGQKTLFVTLLREPDSLYLRLSAQGDTQRPLLTSCLSG